MRPGAQPLQRLRGFDQITRSAPQPQGSCVVAPRMRLDIFLTMRARADIQCVALEDGIAPWTLRRHRKLVTSREDDGVMFLF